MNAPERISLTSDPAALLEGVRLGPAMEKLPSDRQRLFVLCLFEVKPGHGQYARAFRMAGYRARTVQICSANACRLAHDERVQAAIIEEQNRRLIALAPGALRALQHLIGNPRHRDHARAVAMVLDRAAPVETTLNVRREERHVLVDPDRVMAQITQIAKRVGVDLAQLAKPAPVTIEETAVEVTTPPAATDGGDDAAG
jgi:phage terminase small subunit